MHRHKSHKFFHFWVTVIICFPLILLLSWLSSDQFWVVAFIAFFSLLLFCRKKKKNPRGQNPFSCFLHYSIKKPLVCANALLCIWVVEVTESQLGKNPRNQILSSITKIFTMLFPKGAFPKVWQQQQNHYNQLVPLSSGTGN